MAARFAEEPESGREGSATEPVIIAGVNRSGKKRLVPLDDSGSEAPPAAGFTADLLGNQVVGISPTQDRLTNLLPALACLLAVREQEAR